MHVTWVSNLVVHVPRASCGSRVMHVTARVAAVCYGLFHSVELLVEEENEQVHVNYHARFFEFERGHTLILELKLLCISDSLFRLITY